MKLNILWVTVIMIEGTGGTALSNQIVAAGMLKKLGLSCNKKLTSDQYIALEYMIADLLVCGISFDLEEDNKGRTKIIIDSGDAK